MKTIIRNDEITFESENNDDLKFLYDAYKKGIDVISLGVGGSANYNASMILKISQEQKNVAPSICQVCPFLEEEVKQ